MPKLYHQDGQWIVPGQQGKAAIRHDIPSTPVELASWLNARDAAASRTLQTPTETIDPAENTAATHQTLPTLDPDSIEEWIMDTASAAQIETLFTALGVRFHELRRKANGQTTPA